MKTKFVFVLLGIFTFSAVCFSQSVTITPKKIVYTRKSADLSEHKRSFTVIYPIVSRLNPPTAMKKLENTISYWRVFETPLKEYLTDGDTWLDDAFYKINYNKNGILDIALTGQGSAAYPDSQIANLVIDLKTGEQVNFNEVFDSGSLPRFAKLVNGKMSIEKAKIIKEIRSGKFGANGKEEIDSNAQMINDLKFTEESFKEFSVSDRGVTILYDAGFPHVIEALQPEGRYFFTWTQVKPFVRRNGLLGKFIR